MILSIIGNLGADVKTININGKNYFYMNVAHNGIEKDGTGKIIEITHWCGVYLKENPNLLEFLKKGKCVYASGSCRIKTVLKEGKCYLDVSLFAQCFQLL